MPSRDAVGGCPTTGSEEAHRPGATSHRRPSHRLRYLSARALRAALLPRFRLQVAGIAALALIALLLFVFLPPREVRIRADGSVATVESRSANPEVVAAQAGVELGPGDRVERAGDDTLRVERATEVELTVDGQTYVLRSRATSIAQLLSEVGIELGPRDSVLRNRVFVSANEPVAPPTPLAAVLFPQRASIASGAGTGPGPVTLEIRRAVPFTVVENGQKLHVSSSRETVATALRDVGVRVGPGDRVQPPLDTPLTAGLEVHVQHATPIIVTLPEGKLVVYTLAETVGEAVEQSGIALPAQYRLEPPADTSIAPGLAVHVVGISEEQELETERIESQTVYRPDPSLPYGETRVVPGQDGVRYRQYRLVYEDDRLVSRELVAEWFDPEPRDTVIYYSTAPEPTPPPALVDSGELPPDLNVVRVMTVYATWYNPASSGRSPSDPLYGITATGVPVDRGICAVDPSVIPLGTRFYVPGYGLCLAADTGGGIRGNMIDLGYPDGVVPDWTTRWVDIYILGP